MRSPLRGAEMLACVSHQTRKLLWPCRHATRLLGGRSGTKHTHQLSTNRQGDDNLLTEGLRSELNGTAVSVCVVYPGAIGTNIAGNSGLDMSGADTESTRKVVAPRDAGDAIIRAITEDKKRILIGDDATFMWRANRLSPDLASNLIYKGMKDLLPPA